MALSVALFRSLAKALLKSSIRVVAKAVPLGDELLEVATGTLEEWGKQTKEEQRRAELQAIAQAAADQVRQQVAAVVHEIAGDQPPAVQEALKSYMTHVPASIRRSLRRTTDPTGTTVPANLDLRRPEDLVPFLPEKLPRFKQGDRPLAGVDWVLEELLGVGGFGEVWKAKNPHFDGVAPVALKFCLDADAKDRLLRHEAAVLNQVMRHGKHPGIVALQHTYLNADPPCLEYEYVEGGDLAGLIHEWHQSKGGLSPQQATQMLARLAETVAFAHQLQPAIVHRDLKPANILVRRDPSGKVQLKIADFGIGGLAAAQALREKAGGRTTRGQMLTTTVRGSYTPLYASPQQAGGAPPDPRDDVYSLGVIWYQMLTGDLSQGAPSGLDWAQDLTKRGMSRDLVRLLAECFTSKAEKRVPNATALVERLGALTAASGAKTALAAGASTIARTATSSGSAKVQSSGDVPSRRSGHPVVVGLIFAALAVVAGAVLIGSGVFPKKPDEDQRAEKKTSPLPKEKDEKNSSPPSEKPKDDLSDKDKTAKTETSSPKKDSEPKAVKEPEKQKDRPPADLPKPSQIFSEDFAKVKEGDLPAGWKGDGAIGVQEKDDRPHLEVSEKNTRYITLPSFAVQGDFFLECDVVLAWEVPELDITLPGKDGARDLSLKATPFGGNSVATMLRVTLADLDAYESKKNVDPVGRFRLRLERDGAIFRVKVNNETVVARPLRGYKDFEGMRLGLPGGGGTKFYSLKIAKLSAGENAPPPAPSPDEAFKKGYVEDFRNIAEGGLPAGWEGDDAISVMQYGDRPRLEVWDKNFHQVKLPPLAIKGNFYIECDVQLAWEMRSLELKLLGADSGSDLSLLAVAVGGNSAPWNMEIKLADKEPKTSQKQTAQEGQFRLRLEREGAIFRVKVNNEAVVAQRLDGYKDFERVRLSLPGGGFTRFYSIRIGPFAGNQ